MLLSIALTLFAFYGFSTYIDRDGMLLEQRKRLAQLVKKRQELQLQVERAEAKRRADPTARERALVMELVKKRGTPRVLILEGLEEAAPASLVLNSLTIKVAEGKALLSGSARDLKALSQFVDSLGDSFPEVFVLSQRRATQEEHRALGGDAIIFELSLGLKEAKGG